MRCLEVTYNDGKPVIAGAKGAEAITADVILYPTLDVVHVRLFGEVVPESGTPADAQWLTQALRAGDRVTIRLIESDSPSAPKLSRSDPSATADDGIPYVCSFCGKQSIQVERMMKSEKAIICNECIDFMHEDGAKDAK